MTAEEKQKDEFKLLLARNQHLEKVVARYKQAEDWENFECGTKVYVSNSDSLHDGQIGKFLAHFWNPSGYVCLLVEFPDGKRCYYLPIHLKLYRDEPITPEPIPEPIPEPKQVELEVSGEGKRIIEAKLAQVAKMPESARRKILSGTLSPELVPKALEIAKQRGIIP